MVLMRRVFPSSRVFNVNDRIDEGSFPVYTLRLGASAQSGLPPSGHPIDVVTSERSAPYHHPFHCWRKKELPIGARRASLSNIDHGAKSALPSAQSCIPVINLRWE